MKVNSVGAAGISVRTSFLNCVKIQNYFHSMKINIGADKRLN
jgi:hypothetical protein